MQQENETTGSVISESDRQKIIVRTSLLGILANIFLASVKLVTGLVSHSIAIVLDAVNNLSDVLSSVVTIAGAKLAGRSADKKHPYGYGRLEYMSAMIVSVIVLYAGITAFTESVKKIIHPETPDYSVVTLLIIASGVAVKIILGTYVKKIGNKVNSGSLSASGADALSDAVLSFAVLACGAIFVLTGGRVSLEAFVSVGISLFIIRAGIGMIGDALNSILGQRVDAALARRIKSIAAENKDVIGAYDLMLNDYGPDKYIGSIHLEVPDTLSAGEIDRVTHEVSTDVYDKTGVIIAAVGIYSVDFRDDDEAKMRDEVKAVVMGYDHVLQTHGHYVDLEHKFMNFDMVIDYNSEDRTGLFKTIKEDLEKRWPDFTFRINLDPDMSE